MAVASAIVFVIDKWRKKSWIFFLGFPSAKTNSENIPQTYHYFEAGSGEVALEKPS